MSLPNNLPDYCNLGYKVIPLIERNKQPSIKSWPEKASGDMSQLKSWYKQNPQMNIGLYMGDELVCIDVDPRNGGDKSFEKFAEVLLPLNPPKQVSGGGGFHLLFRKLKEQKISTSKLAQGIDLQTGNKFIVAEPSIHPNGNLYSWENGLRTKVSDLPLFPMHILTSPKSSVKSFAAADTPIPVGNRNNALFVHACTLLDKGALFEDVLAHTFAYRDENCEVGAEPISDDEVMKVVASATIHIGKKQKSMIENRDLPYSIHDGVICKTEWDNINKITITKKLCNFGAKIVKEIEKIFPDETCLFYEIEANLYDGTKLGSKIIPASLYEGLSWVSGFGKNAIIYPERSFRDEIRAAIQQLSIKSPRESVYAHIGWTRDGRYLTSSGAITKNSFETGQLFDSKEGGLGNFELPDPNFENPKEIISKVFDFEQLASPLISLSCLAAVATAPLIDLILRGGFTVFCVGSTGSFKSTIAALMQSFWGKNFTTSTLPVSFSSTKYSIEKTLSLCPSSLVTIDDFVPGETAEYIANYIVRGIGNGQGRQRLKSDTTTRPAMIPKCLAVMTSEDYLSGESIRARLFFIEFQREKINLDILTQLQKYASSGVFALAMSRYIQWIANKKEEIKNQANDQIPDLSKFFSNGRTHARTPGTLAQLQFGFQTFVKFAIDEGAIHKDEGAAIVKRLQSTLTEIGMRHAELVLSIDTATRFIECLSLAFYQKRAYLANSVVPRGDLPPSGMQSEKWGWFTKPDGIVAHSGEQIGWIGPKGVILIPDAAYKVALAVSRSLNSPIQVSKETLYRELANKGCILKDSEGNRNTPKARTPNGRMRVLCFPDPSIFLIDAPSAPLAPPPAGMAELGEQIQVH